jgi:membrane protein
MRQKLAMLWAALWELYKDSGFAMAGAVAFGFVVSLFPFCIFVGTLAGLFGGETLAAEAIEQLFETVPRQVAEVLAPEIEQVMGRTRLDLLTFGALLSLFFATSAMEYLRAALNTAYRVKETRNYFWCLGQSALFVIATAIAMLVLGWGIVASPALLARIKPQWLLWLADQSWFSMLTRYGIVFLALLAQLTAIHLWLAAGERRVGDIMPGVSISVVLLIALAALFSIWLEVNDYSRFYAGLSHIMATLIFFQVSAMLIMLGAEFNRGLFELTNRPLASIGRDA